jgi:hypothetical protein
MSNNTDEERMNREETRREKWKGRVPRLTGRHLELPGLLASPAAIEDLHSAQRFTTPLELTYAIAIPDSLSKLLLIGTLSLPSDISSLKPAIFEPPITLTSLGQQEQSDQLSRR